MHLFISTSAESTYDPTKFRWVTFTGVRALRLTKGKASFLISTGTVLGFKFYRAGYFHIVDSKDLDVRYMVSADIMRKLLARCEGYEGKVGRKKVENGKPASTLVTDKETEVKDPKYTKKEAKAHEPKDFAVVLRKMDLPDAKSISFLGSQQNLMQKETLYYFDVTKASAGLGARWESKIETAAINSIKAEVSIGATEIMYNNRLTRVLVICEN